MRRSPNLMDDHVLKRDGRAAFFIFFLLCLSSFHFLLLRQAVSIVERDPSPFIEGIYGKLELQGQACSLGGERGSTRCRNSLWKLRNMPQKHRKINNLKLVPSTGTQYHK